MCTGHRGTYVSRGAQADTDCHPPPPPGTGRCVYAGVGRVGEYGVGVGVSESEPRTGTKAGTFAVRVMICRPNASY